MQFLLYLICNISPLLLLIGNIAISFIVFDSLLFLRSKYIFLSLALLMFSQFGLPIISSYTSPLAWGLFYMLNAREVEKLNEITMRICAVEARKVSEFCLKETFLLYFTLRSSCCRPNSRSRSLIITIPPLFYFTFIVFTPNALRIGRNKSAWAAAAATEG